MTDDAKKPEDELEALKQRVAELEAKAKPPEPPLSAYENPVLGESSMAMAWWSSSIEDTGGAPSSSPCEGVVAPPFSKGTDNG